MKIKRLVALAMTATLAVSAFGCSKSVKTDVKEDVKTIKISFMGDGAGKDAMQKNFDLFNSKHKDIKAEVMYVPVNGGSGWNDYFTKIETMIAGGTAPDISFVAIEGIQSFDSKNLAMPINDYVAKFPELADGVDKDINPNLQKPFVINGKNYGYVTEWNNVVTHFNTTLLKEAGLELPKENWGKQDFLDYCSKLTKKVNGKQQYALAIPNYYFAAEAWLYNNNASILSEDMKKSALNEPNSVEIFQLWQDLIYKYKYAPAPEPNADSAQQLMSGQVAMAFAGRWFTNNYVTNNFKDVAVQYIPNFKTNKVNFGSGAFCVLNSSKNKDAAAQVALWTAGKEFTTAYLTNASIPTRKSVADDVIPKVSVPQNSQLFYKTADTAVAVQAPPQYPAVATVFDKYLSAILSNQMPAKEALDKATIEINAILAKK